MRKQSLFNELGFSMIYITHMVFTLWAAKWQPGGNQLATKLPPLQVVQLIVCNQSASNENTTPSKCTRDI
ncbi:MAG: hypothetical protein CME75_01430 [Halomonas sp.]|nr:hypothetical protein [Halomonas sp.]